MVRDVERPVVTKFGRIVMVVFVTCGLVAILPTMPNGLAAPPSPAGTVTTFGQGLSRPYGIAARPDGNLWVTNWDNNTIGKLTPSGAIVDFTDAGIDKPQEIAAEPDGNL